MARQNLLRCSIALVGLVVAAAAFGAEPTTTTSPKPITAATAGTTEGLSCRSPLRPGSHIREKRTCLTPAQWAARLRVRALVTAGSQGGGDNVSTAGASVGMSAFTAR